MTTFKYHVEHPSEHSAGIRAYSEDISIQIASDLPADIQAEMVEHWRAAIAEWYDGARVHTEAEYQKIIEQENIIGDLGHPPIPRRE